MIKIYFKKDIEVQAIRGFTHTFNCGEITIIMGPSGCGKTSLLNILGGNLPLTAGTVTFDDLGDLSRWSDSELRNYRRIYVSFIFQNFNLLSTLNVKENVQLPLEMMQLTRKEIETRVEENINFVGLNERLTHYPDELSGGEQQRVAIARALAKNSTIILCDEPTGELDTASKRAFMKILRDLLTVHPEKIIIIVTHDPDFKLIADQFLYIRDGRISHKLTSEELKEYRKTHNLDENEISKILEGDDSMDSTMLELMELKQILTEKIATLKKTQ